MTTVENESLPRIRELAPGQIVGGKYRVERHIGAGGMGVVVAANDIQLRRKVAIKVMAPALAADDGAVKRFLREARAVVALTGEHSVRVFDVGELASGIPFIAMEFLVGTDLDSMCSERGRLPFREAVDFLLQAMKGLAEAHAVGIVHRDLKPANLFLTRRSDGTPLVKVLDFGLAKASELPDETKLTGTNVVMGTQQYMSPEQLRGARDVDARTDIWALGVCLYELTTGVLPFDAPLVVDGRRRPIMAVLGEISRRICSETPRVPHEIVTDIPTGLSTVILTCLEKDRANRFANVADLASALERFASPEFRDIGLRLETVLEGQTLARDLHVMRSQPAHDTTPDSSPERVTERMHRGGVGRFVVDADAAIQRLASLLRRARNRVRASGAQSFLTELARDRRAPLILAPTAVVLSLMLLFAVVMLNSRKPRDASMISVPNSAETSAALPISAPSSGPRTTLATASGSSEGAVTPAPPASTAIDLSRRAITPSAAPTATTSAPVITATSPSAAAHRPNSASAPAQKNRCNPPFVKHPDGKVEWTVECL